VFYTKAFYSVWHEGCAVFKSYSAEQTNVATKESVQELTAAVKINQLLGEWFSAKIGSRQGDPVSPMSSLKLLERVTEKFELHSRCVSQSLRFADDVDLLAEDEIGVQTGILPSEHTTKKQCCIAYGLNANIDKTKLMVFGNVQPAAHSSKQGLKNSNVCPSLSTSAASCQE